VKSGLRKAFNQRPEGHPELPSSLDTKVSNEPKSPKVVVSKEVHDMVVS